MATSIMCGNCKGYGMVQPDSIDELDAIDRMVAKTVGLHAMKKICKVCHGRRVIDTSHD